jgi:NADH-quinone oxidoreductase subunit H
VIELSVLDEIIYYILRPEFFVPVIFPGLITSMILLLITIWAERKIAAKVQLRFGPLLISPRIGGLLQLIADLLKFVFSEIIVPARAFKALYILGPALLLSTSLLPLVVIPISTSIHYSLYVIGNNGAYVPIYVNFSLIAALALSMLTPIMVIMTAWATNNRFAVVGALREGFLMITYDVLLIMSAFSMAIIYGGVDLFGFVNFQSSHYLGILMNPISAFVFLVAMLLGSSRYPFEIVEADTEIVIGPYTEYSGLLFILTMGGSYIKTFVYSILFSVIFLGGWLPFSGGIGALFTVFKAIIILLFSVFLRSVYGRYRIDQALRGAWKLMFLLAIISMVLSFIWRWFLVA